MNAVSAYIQDRKRQNEAEPFNAYIYDLGGLQRSVAGIKASLPKGVKYFYAIKANSDALILKALLSIVDGFEVASFGEVKKVRQISSDVPIIFGGPGKTDDEIEQALLEKVSLLHIESLSELRRTDWIAGRLGIKADILLRVNLRAPLPAGTLQMCGVASQFGIDEADLPEAITAAMALSNVTLRGFHYHSLSNHLDAEKHAELISIYIKRSKEWQSAYGFQLDYINAGGGVGINYEQMDEAFDWNGYVGKLARIIGRETDCPEILFECGRYTVASCGYYAAEVLELRRNGDRNYAIVNGGLHQFLLPGAWKHRHPFFIVPSERWPYSWHREEMQKCTVTFAGRMNSPRDILAEEYVASLRPADIIVFPLAGAYGWSISAHDFSSLEHPEFIYMPSSI